MGNNEDLLLNFEAATPALRRYARALCAGADPAAADDLVQTAIEQAAAKLRAKEAKSVLGAVARHCSYRALTELAREKYGRALTAASTSRQSGIALGLAELPFDERASLLLVALEGFWYESAARITDASREDLVARLARARAALSLLDLRPLAPSNGARRAAGHLRIVK